MNILDKTEKFYKEFLGEKGIIGQSVKDKNIYYFAVKKTDYPKIIVQSAIHGREYITAYLTLKLIRNFIKKGKSGTVYFIPIVNPDGVEISLTKKPLYKANANGVDLNVNFDALWGKGEKNVFNKGDENFVGEFPFSEPETRALRDFTLFVKPDLTLSFHSKGEEIYFEFLQEDERLIRDFKYAEIVSNCTGYQIKSTPFSCGGYKDWCINKLKIPALTIEVGSDELSHPIKRKNLRDIERKNRSVIFSLIDSFLEK